MISLDSTFKDMLRELADGNPGAIKVLLDYCQIVPTVDPYTPNPFFHVLCFNNWGLKGPNIWILYKDICKQDIYLFAACIRARQLGFIQNFNNITPELLVAQVQLKLPNWGQN